MSPVSARGTKERLQVVGVEIYDTWHIFDCVFTTSSLYLDLVPHSQL